MKECSPVQGERIVWIDVVRLVAMFTLLCCHCANPFNWSAGTSSDAEEIQFWGGFYGAMLRHSVPLFVMMTGALLLPIKTDAAPFYRKRITRVLWPFLIWSVIYCFFPWFIGLFGAGSDIVQNFFPYAGEDFLTQDLSVAVAHALTIPLQFTTVGLHMWYIYLLIGLYLYMPIFSAWVERASQRAKLWFLVAWGVASLLPYYQQFVSPYVLGSCTWNQFGMLYYFCGYNGYLLLGHYLRNCRWSLTKVIMLGIPMFVIGYCITYFGHDYTVHIPNHSEELFELFWTNCSLNVILMVVPIFMACRLVTVRSERLKHLLANLTHCGYGIYMIHYFFIGYAVILMQCIGCPIGLQIPCAAVVGLAASWICCHLGHRLLGRWGKIVLG